MLKTITSVSGLLAWAWLTSGNAWASCAIQPGGVMRCDASAPDPTTTPVQVGRTVLSLTVDGGALTGGVVGNGPSPVTLQLLQGSISHYDNTLGYSNITFAEQGSASVTGDMQTGASNDMVVMHSGAVAGAVRQGEGLDSFTMTGGVIGMLDQGDQRDVFEMSGGEITGAFLNGDVARMTGGVIGRVDMKLDDNIFDMEGGLIRGNLVTGLGNDQISIWDGEIGGDVSVSSGTDSLRILGGRIGGAVRMGAGDDTLLWQDRSTIAGAIDMGDGDDRVTLRNLSASDMSSTQQIDGGAGADTLVLAGYGPETVAAAGLQNFERLEKTEIGRWTLTGTLTGFQQVTVSQGVLRLAGDNSGFAGETLVAPPGVLEGSGMSLTPRIDNWGLVRFIQADGGSESYAGAIAGIGAIEKTGGGRVTLTGQNTHTGGTWIREGMLAASNDQALGVYGDVGRPNGGDVIIDGGSFGFASSFTLDSRRGISVTERNGGLHADAGVHGVIPNRIFGPGALTKTGPGLVTLAGENTFTGGLTIASGPLQLGDGGTDGSVIGDVLNHGELIFNYGGSKTFSATISGSGAVRQRGTGNTVLTGVSNYSGETIVELGGLVIGGASEPNAALTGGGLTRVLSGGVLGGYGRIAGDVVNDGVIAAASALTGFGRAGVGAFTIDGTVINRGLVQLGNSLGSGAGRSDVGNRLNVGSWVGDGGQLAIRTVLGDDGSATDQLTINGGSASGFTTVRVSNTGGTGAQTHGDGIEVVAARSGAVTTPGAFSLAGPLVAGPYEYELHRGGRDGDGESWYLRSMMMKPTPGPEPVPTTPTTPGGGAPALPYYRAETSLYAALPSMALNYGRAIMGTMHEHMGEQQLWREGQDGGAPGNSSSGQSSAGFGGGWGRVIGQHVAETTSAGGIYGGGPAFNQDIAAIQLGLDLWRRRQDDGSGDHAGVFVAIGQSNGDARHVNGVRAGRVRVDAQTLGAYWTHCGASGWYVDALVQGTWLDATASSSRMMQLSPDGAGLGASLEAGYPLALGGGWSIEPQAQLTWQSIWLDAASDGAAQVRFSDIHSLAGRIGARLSRSWALDGAFGPQRITIWARANLWHEFMGTPRAWFAASDGALPFRSDTQGAWAQLDAGVTAQLNGAVAVYANAGYNFGRGGDYDAWSGKIGVRVNW